MFKNLIRRIVYCMYSYFCFIHSSFFFPDALRFLLFKKSILFLLEEHSIVGLLALNSSFFVWGWLHFSFIQRDNFTGHRVYYWQFFFQHLKQCSTISSWPSWVQMRNLSFKLVFSYRQCVIPPWLHSKFCVCL